MYYRMFRNIKESSEYANVDETFKILYEYSLYISQKSLVSEQYSVSTEGRDEKHLFIDKNYLEENIRSATLHL